jgi:hypothetical protein
MISSVQSAADSAASTMNASREFATETQDRADILISLAPPLLNNQLDDPAAAQLFRTLLQAYKLIAAKLKNSYSGLGTLSSGPFFSINVKTSKNLLNFA